MPIKDSPNRFIASLKNAYKLLRDGHYSIFFNEFQNRLHSESLSFGLQKDLHEPFEKPAAGLKLNYNRKPDVQSETENKLDDDNLRTTILL